ncbi:MAG: hypothetical protein CM15mP59_3600 [Flavobacteriaceae bacterium]|nr:MAG: hypothetical protein CM15mP59_3600 [Flavobacteriaceae bacterium]
MTAEAIPVILRFLPLKRHLRQLTFLFEPIRKAAQPLASWQHIKRAGDIYMIPNQGILIMAIRVQLMALAFPMIRMPTFDDGSWNQVRADLRNDFDYRHCTNDVCLVGNRFSKWDDRRCDF